MRKFILGLLLVLLAAALGLGEEKPGEPTREDLVSVRKAFRRLGGGYSRAPDQRTGRVMHGFVMNKSTTDETLKNLPKPPFAFSLSLSKTKITDEGLKELKDQKNIVSLNLRDTNVTAAGMKQLKDLENLSSLHLAGTKVTGGFSSRHR
jgi:hypothetical protein